MKKLKANLLVAVEEIERMKNESEELRFRIETCVHKDSVKVYVIKNIKIQKVVTIEDAHIINVDEKGM